MALPSGYRPRENDVLVLHAKARFDVEPGEDFVHLDIHNASAKSVIVQLDEIAGIKTRVWHIGESVKHRSVSRFFGAVAGVSGDLVWVKLDPAADQRGATGGHRTFHCNELEAAATPTVIIAAHNPDADPLAEIGEKVVNLTEADDYYRARILQAFADYITPSKKKEIAAATGAALDALGDEFGTVRRESTI